METVVPLLVALFGGGAIVALIVFLNPDKVEQWVALGWKLIDMLFRKGKRAYITHDIQGRVNQFARDLNKEAPHCQAVGIKIEWVDTADQVQDFLSNGRLIVRMRRDDDQNRNFVNASMIFVSKALLPKAKKYLSPTQRESIDLYVGKKLFDAHKPEVIDIFFDEHFSPRVLASEKMQTLLDDYSVIDKVGLFFCVLVRELAYLGDKVFFGPRSDKIIVEVSQLVSFLRSFADREVGTQAVPLQLRGAWMPSRMRRRLSTVLRLLTDVHSNLRSACPAANDRMLGRISSFSGAPPLRGCTTRSIRINLSWRQPAARFPSWTIGLPSGVPRTEARAAQGARSTRQRPVPGQPEA